MFWRVRAVLDDRPGSLAALATACAHQDVNILGLQIFPTTGERVLDELVLRTPEGWGERQVADLCRDAGVEQLAAVPCTAKALEDQPVRYLRAAARVLEEPDRLDEQLGLLHEDLTTDGSGGPGGGTLVRRALFSDTEQAREVHLRRLAAIGDRLRAPVVPPAPATVELRPGTVDDVTALLAMHQRCSAETLYRRYLSGTTELRPRTALELLEPHNGESLVLTRGAAVIAVGTLVPGEQGFEVGLLVEDAEQQRGFGTRLLRALALAVSDRGAASFSLVTHPDNRALVPALAAAGLRPRGTAADGLVRYVVPVRPTGPSPARDLERMAEVTVPLVSLLARRPELREAYPTAAYIDAAVRDGI